MLKEGTKVKVAIPLNEQTAPMCIKKYNGKVTRVKDVFHHGGLRKQFYTYTLKGCSSDFGLDYYFIESWLIPVEESEDAV